MPPVELRLTGVAVDADQVLLLEGVKIGCTFAMLLCLDRDHRLAYILGEILELEHGEAAEVLEVNPAAFRQRLSRAPKRITSFMLSHCGLVNSDNACRCRRRVAAAVELGRIDPDRRLEETRRAAALYRSHPEPRPPDGLVYWLRRVLDRGAASLLDESRG